jgi:hypothetical protein
MTKGIRNPLERPDRYSEFPEGPYWPRFIEKLLLAIINAYPDPSAKDNASQEISRDKRLAAAMKALILTSNRSKGNRPHYDLEYDIKLAHAQSDPLGTNRYNEMFGIPDKPEPVPGPSAVFKDIDLPGGAHSKASLVDRVKKKRYSHKHIDYCDFIVRDNLHREEVDMMEALREVSAILSRFNIDLDLDPHKLAMASLWQFYSGASSSEEGGGE